ncbi:hypothetical protein Plhal304r1_c037g0112411 [Plasmopara halstedii]
MLRIQCFNDLKLRALGRGRRRNTRQTIRCSDKVLKLLYPKAFDNVMPKNSDLST